MQMSPQSTQQDGGRIIRRVLQWKRKELGHSLDRTGLVLTLIEKEGETQPEDWQNCLGQRKASIQQLLKAGSRTGTFSLPPVFPVFGMSHFFTLKKKLEDLSIEGPQSPFYLSKLSGLPIQFDFKAVHLLVKCQHQDTNVYQNKNLCNYHTCLYEKIDPVTQYKTHLLSPRGCSSPTFIRLVSLS